MPTSTLVGEKTRSSEGDIGLKFSLVVTWGRVQVFSERKSEFQDFRVKFKKILISYTTERFRVFNFVKFSATSICGPHVQS